MGKIANQVRKLIKQAMNTKIVDLAGYRQTLRELETTVKHWIN